MSEYECTNCLDTGYNKRNTHGWEHPADECKSCDRFAVRKVRKENFKDILNGQGYCVDCGFNTNRDHESCLARNIDRAAIIKEEHRIDALKYGGMLMTTKRDKI